MNVKADKMRYQANKLGYGLILLGMMLSVSALFMIITPPTVVPNFSTALEILINILLLLVTFLAAERCKYYQKNWAMITIIIAVIHTLRIFWVPMQLVANDQLHILIFIIIAITLLFTSFLMIMGALVTLKRHKILLTHLKEIGEK
jgi:hypothetical protein